VRRVVVIREGETGTVDNRRPTHRTSHKSHRANSGPPILSVMLAARAFRGAALRAPFASSPTYAPSISTRRWRSGQAQAGTPEAPTQRRMRQVDAPPTVAPAGVSTPSARPVPAPATVAGADARAPAAAVQKTGMSTEDQMRNMEKILDMADMSGDIDVWNQPIPLMGACGYMILGPGADEAKERRAHPARGCQMDPPGRLAEEAGQPRGLGEERCCVSFLSWTFLENIDRCTGCTRWPSSRRSRAWTSSPRGRERSSTRRRQHRTRGSRVCVLNSLRAT
jgi:hypothetical protein